MDITLFWEVVSVSRVTHDSDTYGLTRSKVVVIVHRCCCWCSTVDVYLLYCFRGSDDPACEIALLYLWCIFSFSVSDG